VKIRQAGSAQMRKGKFPKRPSRIVVVGTLFSENQQVIVLENLS
jgi:hypothetical protein